jgi:hypothetical protein
MVSLRLIIALQANDLWRYAYASLKRDGKRETVLPHRINRKL